MNSLESDLQHAIENIYRLDRTASVADYRISEEILSFFIGNEQIDQHRETLVVRDEGEVVDLALYLSDEVVRRAHTFAKTGAHLDEFCVATEGVSHFVYVTFCGDRQERSVSQLELELQAEIDKYLVLRILFPSTGADLIPRLYDRFRLAERLSHGERERYTVANRGGRRYARWLHREFSCGRGERALVDARALYRKPMAAKLEHIDRAA